MPLETTHRSQPDRRTISRNRAEFTEHFSEFGLIRARLLVETEYLIALSEAGAGVRVITNEEKRHFNSSHTFRPRRRLL